MKIFALVTAALLTMNIHATTPKKWDCTFDANVEGLVAAFGIGGKVVTGKGLLECESTDINGEVETASKELPVSLIGFVKGFGVAHIRNITITGVGIGLDALDDFKGKFGGVAGAEAGIGRDGIGAAVSFGVSNGSVGFEAELSEIDMFGAFAGVNISAMVIGEPVQSGNDDSPFDPFGENN